MRFAVLGFPIKHSQSPKLFKELAAKHNISLEYDILEIDPKNFFQEKNRLYEYDGLNITSPYKQKILEFVDHKSDEVIKLNACNVIENKNKKLYAHNTDVCGFQKSFERLESNQDHEILILGSGGAARAVELSLRKLNFKNIFFHSKKFPHNLENVRPAVIINATTLGMNDEYTNEDLNFFDLPWNDVTLAYDLIYFPQETIFMKIARRQKVVKIFGGAEMLKYQAEKSFDILVGGRNKFLKGELQ